VRIEHWVYTVPLRLRSLFRRDRVEQELDEELRDHIERQTAQHVAAGMTRADARTAALRSFGGVEWRKEEIRESRGVGLIEHLLQDLKYAVRGLRRSPSFTATAIITLALGIGANTTMFGVLDTLLLKPPAHVRDPGRVQRLYVLNDFGQGQVFTVPGMSVPSYEDLRDLPAFQSVAASLIAKASVGHGADARPVDVSAVTASYLSLFGAPPGLGRFFDSTEDRPGAAPVAVVSYRYWRRQLHSDSAALGRTLPIGRSDYVVVGVALEGFTGGDLTAPDVWLPLRTAASDLNIAPALTRRSWSGITMVARLAPGFTPAAAAAQATLAYTRGSGHKYKTKILLRPIQEARTLHAAQGSSPGRSAEAEVAFWLGGLALAVVLVACANAANLLLVRGLARRRELAVRLALGAGRARVIRQTLVESVMLAAAGGLAALLVALWGGAGVRAFLLPDLPHSVNLLEPRLLVFTAVVATLAGLVAGSAPAWQLSGADAAAPLRSGGRDVTTTRGRLRSTLLAVQVALTLTLLVGAGLFVRSLRNAVTLDYGLDLQHVLIASVEMGGGMGHGVAPGGQEDPQSALYLRLLGHIRTNPTVASVAASAGTPYAGLGYALAGLRVSGRSSVPAVFADNAAFNTVTADYFVTAGTPIVRGRGFTEADEVLGAPPVTVVSGAFARLAWPDRDPIGQCIFVGENESTCAQVIGVAGDTRNDGPREARTIVFYLPHGQHLFSAPIDGLLIRTRGPASEAQTQVQRALQTAEPDLPYVDVESLADRIAPQWHSWRLGAAMFTAFGLLALIIAALGLYAVTAYGVTQRTQEIGVRMALGAQRIDVVWLAVSQVLRAVAMGAGAGGLGALLLSRVVRALLFGVQPADPLTLVVSIGLLLVVAAAAAFVPALRAARTDPMEALRLE
jgi:predicted permease